MVGDVTELQANAADAALYQAKQAGRGLAIAA